MKTEAHIQPSIAEDLIPLLLSKAQSKLGLA